jgi:dCTP deaminase
MPDWEIRKAIKAGDLKILPRLTRLNPAGVDLKIDRDLILLPHQRNLAASIERVELSNKVLGMLHIRSSLAREGLFASLALVDPGFRGQLTISLYNAGDSRVNLKRGERFVQLSLLRVSEPATQGYIGRYQDSRGVVTSRRRKKILHR